MRLANGASSVYSKRYGETYHPVIGPAAEAEALYVRQTDLAGRASARGAGFVIWDVGLGSAANALTVLKALHGVRAELKLISFDRTLEPLRFALEHSEALEYFAGYRSVVEVLARSGRVVFLNGACQADWGVVQDDFSCWIQSDAAEVLDKPDLVLFDPHSPAKNPEMWTQPLFRRLFGLLDPNRPCLLPTYSRSTMLRVSLLLAGFFVGPGGATGEKEETTLASNCQGELREVLGSRWLERARRSRSAEPLWSAEYVQQPISEWTWQQLVRHPQFQAAGSAERADGAHD